MLGGKRRGEGGGGAESERKKKSLGSLGDGLCVCDLSGSHKDGSVLFCSPRDRCLSLLVRALG